LSRDFSEQIDNMRQPVAKISWDEATRYCKLLNKELPSRMQWEKAARGTSGYRYPWGNNWPNCRYTNFSGDPGSGCGTGRTAIVGSRSGDISPFGLYDMGGNVKEFTKDRIGDKIFVKKGGAIPLNFKIYVYLLIKLLIFHIKHLI